MRRSADRLRTALEPPVVVAPGEIWNHSGGCTEILRALLPKCTSKPIDEFAPEALFEPLIRLAAEAPSCQNLLAMRPPERRRGAAMLFLYGVICGAAAALLGVYPNRGFRADFDVPRA
jgi:hypothetical protein